MSSTEALPAVHAAPRVVPFVRDLAAHGGRCALVTSGPGRREVSYAELAARVAALAGRLGVTRRLVLVEGANDLDAVTAYLGALAGGHVVLLVPPGGAGPLLDAYDPDVVLARPDGSRDGPLDLRERRAGSAHELHPELALLLSTSGSTGSPKLVRLSQENVQSNAESIASYLGIRPSDRAVTTLPVHYCYGLSVLHSHLLRGASVVLTGLSVVDRCFWDLVRSEGCTSFAGVPYTFDLLERVGFERMALPSLRYVTQAGGRLDPERVRRFAELGRRSGWDLFVMYGQTEATARMAYLPPDRALEHPGAIGVAVPGGSFALEPVPELDGSLGPGVGEIVYSGPNVMLGYAQSPADLALGRAVEVLRTGDLGRRCPDGLYEVVGRRSRFVKVFGLRIDLQQAERVLAEHGLRAACVGADEELVVAVAGEAGAALRLAVRELGLPPHAVRVCRLEELPRLSSGKLDYARIRELARGPGQAPAGDGAGAGSVRALYAELLDRPDVGDGDTFVGLGGDSLSYVEVSVRLEELLGVLPPAWHTTPVGELQRAAAGSQRPVGRRRFGRSLETGVVLRAVAIVLIVGTHAKLFTLLGSAHVLFALAGYNFARFQLASPDRRERLRGQLVSVARVVVPSVVWIAAAALVTGTYGLLNVVLLNAVLGPESWTRQWHFWFVEVLVYVLLGLVALLAVPAVHRLERRRPFALPCAVLAVGLLGRYGVLDLGVPNPKPVLWLFALGWMAARASDVRRRALVSAAVVATVPGFFGDPWRDALIAAGVVLLTWVPVLRCPARLSRLLGVLASSSLYVYLTHWQVYPHLVGVSPVLAVVASLAVGVAYWALASALMRRLPRRAGRAGARLPRPRAAVEGARDRLRSGV
ncbi:acyl-CoA synthetase (AMP-forming)/AMP-acid ligase II [Kineococcus xinjiangensis]|uniref:Acyl-CoA synthetase (AMP-forming)/AMP-acid ligase II n=1 Tax=Kineococcus xinjiangensis TaxID=512762 RepID=A0A2S6ITW3_9ACTN|nr:AMP-binding protein [Kineococcus xinjiangensis]PPK97611.1 acyl-CoA synthetase (AMP-forming)/AMP-acid ligase II [Kineococcus xinjiangensis]